MTLANLRILARGFTPEAVTSRIDADTIDLILNNGVIDISAFTCCLKSSKKFNAIAEQSEYSLSTVLGDYLTPDKPGLWWYDSSKWKQIYARTLAYLDKNKSNWRDLSSGDPQDYAIDGDTLTMSPKPNTSLTEGLWFYYGKKPTNMTSPEHYPFSGSTTEYTHLSIFDDAILEYAKWKIFPMFNKLTGEDLSEKRYYRIRQEKFDLFKTRRDISISEDARMLGPKF